MSNDTPNDGPDVSPPQEPAATPLISAADIPLHQKATHNIPEERLYALDGCAERIADSWYGERDRHLTGLVGENAVAQHLGVPDELNTEVIADGGDGGVDLVFNGAGVDVKTVGRHIPDPALTVSVGQGLRADYYVLASRIGPADVRLIGYAPRKFVANARKERINGKQYHYVEQEYLFPFPMNL